MEIAVFVLYVWEILRMIYAVLRWILGTIYQIYLRLAGERLEFDRHGFRGERRNFYTRLRPIVIDGSNVAFAHGRNQGFSCKGIKLCVDYFKRRHHSDIKVFLPNYRRRHRQTIHPEILDLLDRQGHIIYTPSKCIDGQWFVPYDDRYIVQYAHRKGAVIISNDRFRDLSEEHPEWIDTISKRVLMFNFIDGDIVFAEDPFGRRGPTLRNLLRF